jgi:hypothetical protein
MAILLDFRKVREDKQEVEYTFGLPEAMDRRLVIEKESQQGNPLDGNRDSRFAAVFVKILRYYQRETTWPEQGSYAA